MTGSLPLYDEDFVRWSETQAEALREVAGLRTNLPLDWTNLAEEIDGLGRSQRQELRRRTRTLVEHLLKLEGSAAEGPKAGLRRTIRRTRFAIADLLADSPSLRSSLPDVLAAVQPEAGDLAADALEDGGEPSDRVRARIGGGGYTGAQAFGPWLPGDDPG